MTNIGLKQISYYKNRINCLEKIKEIDKKKIKKIIIIGSLVIIVAIGNIIAFKYIAGFNILETLSTLVVNEKVIEGADFSKEIIKEGAKFSLK